MVSLILTSNLFIFLFVFKVAVVIANDNVKNDNIDRGSRSEPGSGLWFGPRLGKRASWANDDEDDRQTFLRLLEAADALRHYYDQLSYDKYDVERDAKSDGKGDENKVSKKIILTPKLGRSVEKYESVDFTPRLGRRRTDLPSGFVEQEQYRPDSELDSRRFFSPRLGRTGNMNFSPRLGREIAYELYPEKIRIVRSINKTKSD